MARDLAQHGIRVCTIAPGLFDTALMRTLPPASPWHAGAQRLHALLTRLAAASEGQRQAQLPVAGDFLRAVALTLMGWARARLGRLDAAWDRDTGAAFDSWVWPEQAWRCEMVERALGEPAPLP